MESKACSFLTIAGGHCSSNMKDIDKWQKSVQIVLLPSCNQDISRQRSTWIFRKSVAAVHHKILSHFPV